MSSISKTNLLRSRQVAVRRATALGNKLLLFIRAAVETRAGAVTGAQGGR